MYIKKASIQGMRAPSASSAVRHLRIRLSQVAMVHMEHKNCKIQMHSHLKSLFMMSNLCQLGALGPRRKMKREMNLIL